MITFPFTDVINAIRNAKKGVEVRENLAQMGEYCKKFTDEAGTRADEAKEAAETAATNAKASEKKATDAVAGIEQTKTDAVQAVQNAQTTATNAVQQAQSNATTAVTTKQTEAVQAVGTAKAGAVKAVDDERDAALQQVADSTKAAQTAATNAAASKQAAQASKEAAATSAGAAENSATAASGSASAAATSESNAASSAQSANTDADRAEAAAALAGTRANTDKILKTENAPADAKAVGDIILDRTKETPQPIFYSKASVNELLTKKLGLHDTADNSAKWGDYERRFNEVTDSTLVLVETDGKYVDLCPADRIGLTAIVASGSDYVRFIDGTQICWGGDIWLTSGSDPGRITFPQAFSSTAYGISLLNCTHSDNDKGYRYADRYKTYVEVVVTGGGTVELSYIAVGRWK